MTNKRTTAKTPATPSAPRGPRAKSASLQPTRIGLALAGGGPLGAIYEIGALCALDEALDGLDFNRLAGYVGVSAGSFLAAGLANDMTPREMCAAFIENDASGEELFSASLLMQPAWGEYLRRVAALPGLTTQAVMHYALKRRSLLEAVERLGRALPTGLMSSAAMEKRLAKIFSMPGRSNDFRTLPRKLVLVATDLDSGQAIAFGAPGHDDVPISLAARASSALPGLYPPVRVQGRWCVDGALKKTLHASVLLDEGLDLLICLNPLVPFDATRAEHHKVLSGGEEKIPELVEGGLPTVLSQTFRSLIHSRLELGLKGYAQTHPDTDIVLFEPDHRDGELYLANTFSLSQRRLLAEHAYQRTREALRSRRSKLMAQLERHGITLNSKVLDDMERKLIRRRGKRDGFLVNTRTTRALQKLDHILTDLESRHERS